MPARRTVLSVVAAVLLSGAGVLTTGVATADTPETLQAQIDAAKSELATLQASSEAVAEQMNAARIAQGTAERKAAAAQVRLQQVDAEVAEKRAAIGDLAARSFEASTERGLTLLGSRDPSAFLDRASDLAQVGRSRAQALDALRAASKRQTDARTATTTAVAERTQVTDQIASQRTTLEAGLTDQRRVVGELQTRQAELVRQAEEAARQAAAAEQAAALAAAQAARDEQARLDAQAAALAAAAAPAPRPAPAVTTSAVIAAPAAPAAPPAVEAEPAPPARAPGSAAAIAVAAARAELGKAYVYGAAGPNTFDCSGLTQWAYGKAGIALSHYTGAQWNEGRHVSRGELQPGDLVFFYSDLHHMGMYVGGGQMIHAPHTGDVVKISPLFDNYMGAVRPTG